MGIGGVVGKTVPFRKTIDPSEKWRSWPMPVDFTRARWIFGRVLPVPDPVLKMLRNHFPSAVFAAALLALSTWSLSAQTRIPALVDEPTNVRVPGTLLWTDLFTADPSGAADFYSKLFGWEVQNLGATDNDYRVFFQDGRPVAGVVNGPQAPDGERGGRWISYVSVEDVKETVSRATADGGRVILPPVNIPNRGEHAILTDPEGAIFGLLRTTTGDPEDFLPEVNDLVWLTVFSNDTDAMSRFYEKVLGLRPFDDIRTEVDGDYILASGGSARAGLYPLAEDSEYRPEWIGFVRVNDVGAVLAKAVELGGKALSEPFGTELGNVCAFITDPSGAIFGVAEVTPETEEVLSE